MEPIKGLFMEPDRRPDELLLEAVRRALQRPDKVLEFGLVRLSPGWLAGAAGPLRGCSGTTMAPAASAIAGAIGAATGRPGCSAGVPAPLGPLDAREPRGGGPRPGGNRLGAFGPCGRGGRPAPSAGRNGRPGNGPGPRLAPGCGNRATGGCSAPAARLRGGRATPAAWTGATGSGGGGSGRGMAASRAGSGAGSGARANGAGRASGAGSLATSRMAAARLEGLRSPRPETGKLMGGLGFSPPAATAGDAAAANEATAATSEKTARAVQDRRRRAAGARVRRGAAGAGT